MSLTGMIGGRRIPTPTPIGTGPTGGSSPSQRGERSPCPGDDRDLTAKTNNELVALLDHPNVWYRRKARRLLAERRAADVAASLRETVTAGRGAAALEALWALYGCVGLDEATAETLLAASRCRRPRLVRPPGRGRADDLLPARGPAGRDRDARAGRQGPLAARLHGPAARSRATGSK